MLGKESYYHVYVTLFEYDPGSRLDLTHTVPRRLAGAFLWALPWWLVVVAGIGVLAGGWVSVQTLWPRRSGR